MSNMKLLSAILADSYRAVRTGPDPSRLVPNGPAAPLGNRTRFEPAGGRRVNLTG